MSFHWESFYISFYIDVFVKIIVLLTERTLKFQGDDELKMQQEGPAHKPNVTAAKADCTEMY